MDNGTIAIMVVAAIGLSVELVWSLFLYTMKKLDQYFHKRLMNQLWEENKMSYLEHPAVLIDDKGKEYWL